MKKYNLLEMIKKSHKDVPTKLLSLDPGHTTGFAVFIDGNLAESGEINTADTWDGLFELFERVQPVETVYENYRVYAHKALKHTNQEIRTLRVIGAIEYHAWLYDVVLESQMASEAKGFCSDSLLKKLGLWVKGQRHARDAIRHGVYYMLVKRK